MKHLIVFLILCIGTTCQAQVFWGDEYQKVEKQCAICGKSIFQNEKVEHRQQWPIDNMVSPGLGFGGEEIPDSISIHSINFNVDHGDSHCHRNGLRLCAFLSRYQCRSLIITNPQKISNWRNRLSSQIPDNEFSEHCTSDMASMDESYHQWLQPKWKKEYTIWMKKQNEHRHRQGV